MNDMLSCKFVPITDVLSFIVDNRGKSVPTSSSGFPLIATNCVLNTRLYPVFEKIRYVSEEILHTWFRAELKPNDILFVNKGTPGRVCLVPDPVSFCAAQDMIGLRANPELIDYRYLLAVLRSPAIQKKIQNYHVGIAIPHFKKEDLSNLYIPLPSMETQSKIGKLYIDYCEKIENNNAICADLEGMAKLLYDYWFVQFDFPDENGKPYKSSGGKMVWNEELKREIPEGWEAGYLKNLFEKVNESILAEKKGNLPYTPMDSLPMKQLTFGERFGNKEANSSLIRYKKYDILFGAMRAYFHRVCIAPYEGITRTTTFVLRPLEMNQLGFAYETINQDVAVAYAVKRSVGTQQPYAEWDNNFDSFAFALPPKNLITIYSQKVQGIIDACIHYRAEVAELASLRDFLLPMLMNGQIKVKGA